MRVGGTFGADRNVCIFLPDHRFSKRSTIEAQDLAGETMVDIDLQFAAHQINFNALRFAVVQPEMLAEFDYNGHEAGYISLPRYLQEGSDRARSR